MQRIRIERVRPGADAGAPVLAGLLLRASHGSFGTKAVQGVATQMLTGAPSF